jgi:AraC-like DNA-binding protein
MSIDARTTLLYKYNMDRNDDCMVYWVCRMTADEKIIWPKTTPKPFHCLFTCLQGGARFRIKSQLHEIRPDESLLFRADDLTEDVVTTHVPTHYQWVSFFSPLGDKMPLRLSATRPEALSVLFDRLLSNFERHGSQSKATRFWMRAILRAIEEDNNLDAATPAMQAGDIIRTFIQQIDAHPEMFWSVGEMAEQAGYSKTHFSRTFKKLTGKSPQRYLAEARVFRGQDLLTTTDLTVTEISRQLGYQDVYHFSKQFRQLTGRPPSDYRQNPPVKE